MAGEIYIKNKDTDEWGKYQCIFSAGYIYFFKDVKSTYPEFEHYVRKSKVE